MGTTKTDTQTGKYDPGSMQLFQGLTGSLGPLMQGFMNNPYGNQQFQLEQQLGNTQARNMGQTATSGLLNNAIGSGMAGGASNPAMTEMLQNQARANTGLQANLGFLAPTQAAQQRQFGTMGLAAGYRPLQTGQQDVQSTQGLGTWLPQLLNAGMGIAGMAMGMPPSIHMPGSLPTQTGVTAPGSSLFSGNGSSPFASWSGMGSGAPPPAPTSGGMGGFPPWMG